MIEHATLARAAIPETRTPWRHPTLPRGPSPLARRVRMLRARLAAIVAPKPDECAC